MQLCIFEDQEVNDLYPITLTRPAFEVVCGTGPLWRRQCGLAKADTIRAIVRPELADLCRAAHPDWIINDHTVHNEPTLYINARWLPPTQSLGDLSTPRAGLINNELAYAVAPVGIDFEECRHSLPNVEASGVLLRYPWQAVEHNAAAIGEDALQPDWTPIQSGTIQIVGPSDDVKVRGECRVEPYVVADTRNGPVLIDEGTQIQAFSRIEGPCYIGRDSIVYGGKLSGSTIGPQCRVGGEVEVSIIHGHSNKYHDGFLGHSYIGEWVNLAAGTQTSDLRADYGPVSVKRNGRRIATGSTKVGAFIGDHSKTGLNTLFNPGTTIGAFTNVLPTAGYLPTEIPSFCNVHFGSIQERTEFRDLLQTAEIVLQRRGCVWPQSMTDFVYTLYEATAEERERIIRDREQKQWRRSA